MCFLAFRFPREVEVYQFKDTSLPKPIGQLSIDHPQSQDVPEDPQALEVHSIDLLQLGSLSYLLLGMRHGYLLSSRFEYDVNGHCSFTDQQSTMVGHTQVEFLHAPHEVVMHPYTFLSSDSLWEVRIHDTHLEIDEVLFDSSRTVNY